MVDDKGEIGEEGFGDISWVFGFGRWLKLISIVAFTWVGVLTSSGFYGIVVRSFCCMIYLKAVLQSLIPSFFRMSKLCFYGLN